MSCEQCPLKVSLDTAVELLAQVSNSEANRALGGIAITDKTLELVSTKIDCSGKVTSAEGKYECPLKDVVMLARSFAVSPWPQATFIADLALGITATNQEESAQHGTYI